MYITSYGFNQRLESPIKKGKSKYLENNCNFMKKVQKLRRLFNCVTSNQHRKLSKPKNKVNNQNCVISNEKYFRQCNSILKNHTITANPQKQIKHVLKQSYLNNTIDFNQKRCHSASNKRKIKPVDIIQRLKKRPASVQQRMINYQGLYSQNYQKQQFFNSEVLDLGNYKTTSSIINQNLNKSTNNNQQKTEIKKQRYKYSNRSLAKNLQNFIEKAPNQQHKSPAKIKFIKNKQNTFFKSPLNLKPWQVNTNFQDQDLQF